MTFRSAGQPIGAQKAVDNGERKPHTGTAFLQERLRSLSHGSQRPECNSNAQYHNDCNEQKIRITQMRQYFEALSDQNYLPFGALAKDSSHLFRDDLTLAA